MALHETAASTAVDLYNDRYLTSYGVKTIEFAGGQVVVHETSNLRDLIDAYFREGQGILPRNFNEQVAAAKLANPVIHFLLQGFMRLNPELKEQLEAISRRREIEYEKRQAIRFRSENRVSIGTSLKHAEPSEKEEAFRDFIYSQTQDYIGDLVTTYRLDFNLEDLIR